MTKKIRTPKLRGWTFIEVVVTIGIILVLTSAVGFMAFKYFDQAKIATAKAQVQTYAMAVNAYYLDCKQYPDPQAGGLNALFSAPAGVEGWNGPYVDHPITNDPWGHPYQLKVPGSDGLPFEVISLGPGGNSSGNTSEISSAH